MEEPRCLTRAPGPDCGVMRSRMDILIISKNSRLVNIFRQNTIKETNMEKNKKDKIDIGKIKVSEIIRQRREIQEIRALMHSALAALCIVCAIVLIIRGNVFAVIAVAGEVVNVFLVADDISKIRELKIEEEERMIEIEEAFAKINRGEK
jgi:hypothetical protein